MYVCMNIREKKKVWRACRLEIPRRANEQPTGVRHARNTSFCHHSYPMPAGWLGSTSSRTTESTTHCSTLSSIPIQTLLVPVVDSVAYQISFSHSTTERNKNENDEATLRWCRMGVLGGARVGYPWWLGLFLSSLFHWERHTNCSFTAE
jgi:hypothetical protein